MPNDESSKRATFFVECKPCGERWKWMTLTLPCPADQFLKRKTGDCPNCGEPREIFMCPNEGPNAVTAARDGRVP